MTALLALLSAGFYGVADFLGGVAAKSTFVAAVLALSQAVGLLWLVIFAALYSPLILSGQDIFWGIAAGTSMGLGMISFYFGLARGRMSVVAPIAGLCAIIVPVIAGMAFGEQITTSQFVGILLALIAVVLVTKGSGAAPEHQPAAQQNVTRSSLIVELICAPCAGIGVGLFYVCLDQTNESSGLWPLVCSRGAGSILGFSICLLAIKVRPPASWQLRAGIWASVACGTSDALATMMYLLAARQGLLSIVGPLASLYPIVTVALARLVYKERLFPIQIFGVTLAVFAIILILG